LLSNVNIPHSISSINSGVFSYCAIESISIPKGVRVIENSAFESCRIESLYIPPSVKVINANAFSGNPLNSIELSEGLEIIRDNAFRACSFATIVLPNSLRELGSEVFAYCEQLSSIIIPENVRSMGKACFNLCSALDSITWNAIDCHCVWFEDENDPDSYIYTPFRDIAGQIKSFIIGKNVKVLPDYLCRWMNNLSAITIPSNVIEIGVGCFSSCTSLTTMYVLSKTIEFIGIDAFYSLPSLKKIYVDKDCKATLLQSGIGGLGDIFIEI
jgi:hypothetical protein